MKVFILLAFVAGAFSSQEICGENQRYTSCGITCPLTCDNYNNPPKICNLMCYIGCECVEGYVKTVDGRCVLPESCPVSESVSESACDQEKKVGPCMAAFRRFYFNKETGQCEMFIYGGCQGNSNNFNSKEDCEAVCVQ